MGHVWVLGHVSQWISESEEIKTMASLPVPGFLAGDILLGVLGYALATSTERESMMMRLLF